VRLADELILEAIDDCRITPIARFVYDGLIVKFPHFPIRFQNFNHVATHPKE